MQFTTSTFQCVLITDGSASYAVFIYDCGGMEWGGAEIGWQATSSLYQKHNLSGYYSTDVGCAYSSSYSAIVYRLDSKYVRSPVVSIHSHVIQVMHVILMSLNVTTQIVFHKVLCAMISTAVETTVMNGTVV